MKRRREKILHSFTIHTNNIAYWCCMLFACHCCYSIPFRHSCSLFLAHIWIHIILYTHRQNIHKQLYGSSRCCCIFVPILSMPMLLFILTLCIQLSYVKNNSNNMHTESQAWIWHKHTSTDIRFVCVHDCAHSAKHLALFSCQIEYDSWVERRTLRRILPVFLYL